MNPYQKLLERKRTWTPVQTNAGTVKVGAQDVLKPPCPCTQAYGTTCGRFYQ